MNTNEQTSLFTDEQVREWAERHGFQRVSDARLAMEDVVSLNQLSARASLAEEMVSAMEGARVARNEEDFWEKYEAMRNVMARYRQATASGKEGV